MTLHCGITVKDGHAEVVIARRYTGFNGDTHTGADKLCDLLEPVMLSAVYSGLDAGIFKTAVVTYHGERVELKDKQTKSNG